MIRAISKKIKIMKQVEVEENVMKEKIVTILQYPDQKILKIDISLINNSDTVVGERTAYIKGNDYDLLFSDSDIFEENKNAGCYREIDLWKIIDRISVN